MEFEFTLAKMSRDLGLNETWKFRRETRYAESGGVSLQVKNGKTKESKRQRITSNEVLELQFHFQFEFEFQVCTEHGSFLSSSDNEQKQQQQ